MTVAAEANFSDLLQHPKDTLARLAARPRIRLRRRGDDDLVVTTGTRYDQEREVVAAACRIILRLAEVQPDEAVDLMLAAFPWLRFLPVDDIRTFVHEFVDILIASNGLDNFAPVWQLLTEWKHTAEIHADPDLLKALTSEGEDHGPVPAPTAA